MRTAKQKEMSQTAVQKAGKNQDTLELRLTAAEGLGLLAGLRVESTLWVYSLPDLTFASSPFRVCTCVLSPCPGSTLGRNFLDSAWEKC